MSRAAFDKTARTGASDHLRSYKRLPVDEADRVRSMVKALQEKTLLRPDLRDVFELCDGVILTLMSNRIDCAVVLRLKALFDEHEIV